MGCTMSFGCFSKKKKKNQASMGCTMGFGCFSKKKDHVFASYRSVSLAYN
ncbi:hypothetical protein HanXRQr2_Chr08g0349511 [Helianthus annuus]|uniref:Uncharacterized protein n=1 Tax=Helianthus annuus TaxID=4232 RepID=A0A9K3IG23_HELAN|nr:hypothetical protein HanXRQr2_Chr08g0349511 [Helianthus annuus]